MKIKNIIASEVAALDSDARRAIFSRSALMPSSADNCIGIENGSIQ